MLGKHLSQPILAPTPVWCGHLHQVKGFVSNFPGALISTPTPRGQHTEIRDRVAGAFEGERSNPALLASVDQGFPPLERHCPLRALLPAEGPRSPARPAWEAMSHEKPTCGPGQVQRPVRRCYCCGASK